MRVAALDLGSNTFILLIADVEQGEIRKVLVDETRVVRLGQNLFDTGEFHPQALQRADQCFEEFRQIIDKYHVDKVVSVATSASREAKNKATFFTIADKYKIPVKIINGELEAQLTYKGACGRLNGTENMVVVDVGGGSTEVVGQDKSKNLLRHSFNLGCVRLNEKFLKAHPVKPEEVNRLKNFIWENLNKETKLFNNLKGSQIVAVAGTPTTVADIILGGGFDREKIDKTFISLAQWNQILEQLASLTPQDRLKIPGMRQGREDVIIAGMLILQQIAEKMGAPGFYVSTKGVRYGLAMEASLSPDF